MYDIIAIGEVLVDFSAQKSEKGHISFTGTAGGAPCNVLAQAAKLGAKTAFIGVVGDDLFGKFLKGELMNCGISIEGLIFTSECNTTLTFVINDENGERSFEFFRKPGADTLLRFNDVKYEIIEKSRIFHYGSVAMSKEPCRSTLFEVLERVKTSNKIISYDPNLRFSIWDDIEDLHRYAIKGMEYADILKFSEDELEFLTDETEMDKGVDKIQKKYGPKLVIITRGRKGCRYYFDGRCGENPGYKVTAVDTTGAGDSFLGALLYRLLECDSLNNLRFDSLKEYVDFANAAGALSTTRKGTMSAMPLLTEIEYCRKMGLTY
jgi:fructokinase